MRTTLDIDDVVLSAARSLAASQRISLGSAVSELAMRGLRKGPDSPGSRSTVDVSWPGFAPLVGFAPKSVEAVGHQLAALDDERDAEQVRAGLDG